MNDVELYEEYLVIRDQMSIELGLSNNDRFVYHHSLLYLAYVVARTESLTSEELAEHMIAIDKRLKGYTIQ